MSGRADLADSKVSIPSSSGHQFTGKSAQPPARRAFLVSIPSSSGHQFTAILRVGTRMLSPSVFQSLLHQGISLLLITVVVDHHHLLRLFQSLLHQGISLLACSATRRNSKSTSFQSLLHQGISLLGGRFFCVRAPSFCFNPFFIRASVYCVREAFRTARNSIVSIPSSSGHQFTGP